MMGFEISPPVFCPDLDSYTIPGAITDMSGFAPLERGGYGSARLAYASSTIPAQMVHATVHRFLNTSSATSGVDVGGVATFAFCSNRVYSLSQASWFPKTGTLTVTDEWGVAQFGNAVIATNFVDTPIVSINNADFSTLSGSPPNARLIASNANFVMLGYTSDGTTYPDEVWWSALQNPFDWTPDIDTQCGRIRLLDTPGHLTALVAFKDVFVAFKSNSIYIGEYVGPPFIFSWRVLTRAVGVDGWQYLVTQLEDKLYFVHHTGMYEFDGTQIRNISKPLWRSVLNELGYVDEYQSTEPGDWHYDSALASGEEYLMGRCRLAVDTLEGNVWLFGSSAVTVNGGRASVAWVYNVQSGMWSRFGPVLASYMGRTGRQLVPLMTNIIDAREAMSSVTTNKQDRMWVFVPEAGGLYTDALFTIRYPYDVAFVADGDFVPPLNPDNDFIYVDTDPLSESRERPYVTTSLVGTPNGSSDTFGVHVRCLSGSDASAFNYCVVTGYANESKTTGKQAATAILNADLDKFDGRLNCRYKLATVYMKDKAQAIVAGVGIEAYPMSKAR